MKKISFAVAMWAVLALGACATTTSGPVIPGTAASAGTKGGTVLSALLGTNVLMDDPTVLTLEAQQACNVGAAQEYRLSVAACSGGLAGLVPGFVMPSNLPALINAACNVLGYTNAQNQLTASSTLTVGNCAAVLNLTAPPPAAVAPAAVLPLAPAPASAPGK